MTTHQYAVFAGLPLVGVDVVVPRGTHPGIFRLRIPYDQPLDIATGTLTVTSDETATFANVRPDLSSMRLETTVKGKQEWVVVARDRRVEWKDMIVGGVYNRRRRDNSIILPSSDVATLADVALVVAGETGGSDAPAATPTMDWDTTTVTDALDALSAILPVHVCRTALDAFIVRQTGSGASLPSNAFRVLPGYTAKVDYGPKTIKIRCAPTWFQCGLVLEAVGEDTDGEYKAINSLSYAPGANWYTEWPTVFAGVAQNDRPLAFRTVFRCYRVKTGQELPFNFEEDEAEPEDKYTLTDLDDIDLDEKQLVFDADREPPAIVNGVYWPYSDHYENVDNCPIHSGDFVLDKDQRMIRFEYPVWQKGSDVDEADLKLYTAFHLRDADTGDWIYEEFEIERDTGEGEQIIYLPFLWRARAFPTTATCAAGTEEDNLTDLTAEAQVYLDAWKAHWDKVRDKRFMWYAGTHNLDLSGNIAEITYRVGRGLPPYTRASEHFRHSLVRV